MEQYFIKNPSGQPDPCNQISTFLFSSQKKKKNYMENSIEFTSMQSTLPANPNSAQETFGESL